MLAVDRAQARRARTVEKPASRDVLNGRRNGLVNTGANVGFIRSPDRCVCRPPHRAAPGTSREAYRAHTTPPVARDEYLSERATGAALPGKRGTT